MPTRIHSTAIVEDGAQLGVEVDLGAYAYVGAGVQIGDGTRCIITRAWKAAQTWQSVRDFPLRLHRWKTRT